MQRHITVSSQEGLVTELEVTGVGKDEQYILRYHKPSKIDTMFDAHVSATAPWIGFRYRDTQWSIVMRESSHNEEP